METNESWFQSCLRKLRMQARASPCLSAYGSAQHMMSAFFRAPRKKGWLKRKPKGTQPFGFETTPCDMLPETRWPLFWEYYEYFGQYRGFWYSEMSTSEQECGLEACARTSRSANRQ